MAGEVVVVVGGGLGCHDVWVWSGEGFCIFEVVVVEIEVRWDYFAWEEN